MVTPQANFITVLSIVYEIYKILPTANSIKANEMKSYI